MTIGDLRTLLLDQRDDALLLIAGHDGWVSEPLAITSVAADPASGRPAAVLMVTTEFHAP